MVAFLVARNPDPHSGLPYLLRLPIEGGLWLKAREAWPRASRVYCHPAPAQDPGRLNVLEAVDVVACARRGATIDLVLARGVNRRSQFVFTETNGRPTIFWQTPKAAAQARPGVRLTFGATPIDRILIDTRERYGYGFRSTATATERVALRAGDYIAVVDGYPAAVVERKTADDFAHSLSSGSLAFSLAEFNGVPAALVVEGSYSRLLRAPFVSGTFLADALARLHVRYPEVAVVFVETRALGEHWTFAFFRAAAVEGRPQLPLAALLERPPGD